MITGAHFLLYSREAEADRRFLRDVLGFRGVDAGDGWFIFASGGAVGQVGRAEWGSSTTVTLPSGGEIGLYQPSHPTAIGP